MGSRVSPNSNCLKLRTPCNLCHSRKTPCAVPSLPLKNVTVPCRLVYGFTFSGLRNLRAQRVKRACSTPFDDEFHHEGSNDDDVHDHDHDYHGDESGKEIAYAISDNTKNRELKDVSDGGCSSGQFCTMKPDLLEPSLLGIQPEPPSWPEREEILRLSFERRVKGVGIPFSIRMIKKKLQLQKSFNEASDLTHSSVKKAFSSMLFIFHQLQNHALQTRENMFLEDFEGVMDKLRVDMDASFVWLFQQVFWKTPTFMVYVMVLLANFSVFHMSNNNAMAATPSPMVTNILPLTEKKSEQQHSLQVGAEVEQDEGIKEEELTEEEKVLWDSMVEEASSMLQKGSGDDEVLDGEIRQGFVAPVSVKLEGDRYEEYVKTELYYQKHLRRSPHNSLLLSNYAHFLYLVAHDLDRAEEYYRRSVLAESPEAEAFSRYADFLWLVRKDIWAAELRYLQALEAEPGNTYYVSKYASFLWNTGGQDSTSFPLEELDNLQL